MKGHKIRQKVEPKEVRMTKLAPNSDLLASVLASVGTNFDPSHTNAATSLSLHVGVSGLPLLYLYIKNHGQK